MTGRWASLLFVVAFVGPGLAASKPKYLFHIPWACSIVHADGHLVGAGTIIEMDRVLVSVDNFNNTVPGSVPPKRFFEVMESLYVYTGSNYMDPTKLKKKPRYMQVKKAVRLYVAFKVSESNGGTWDIKLNPDNIPRNAELEYDAYGLAFGVGILVLSGPLSRSVYVLPALVKGPDLPKRTKEFKSNLETSSLRFYSCVTYSWNQELNKIRYHEVTYLIKRSCLEVFCDWDLASCRQFPMRDYLLCFKSVKYVDVCPNARGAALYCPKFSNSVFAILTAAPSCGLRHVPGVYTTMPKIIDFFEKAFNIDFQLDRRTSYDLFTLPQTNSDYDGVL